MRASNSLSSYLFHHPSFILSALHYRILASKSTHKSSMRSLICVIIGSWCCGTSSAFTTSRNGILRHRYLLRSSSLPSDELDVKDSTEISCRKRRSVLMCPVVSLAIVANGYGKALAAEGSLIQIVSQLKESSSMLDEIPDLIKAEKWDAGE